MEELENSHQFMEIVVLGQSQGNSFNWVVVLIHANYVMRLEKRAGGEVRGQEAALLYSEKSTTNESRKTATHQGKGRFLE